MRNESLTLQITDATFPDLIETLLRPVEQTRFDFSTQSSAEIGIQISNLTPQEICGHAVVDEAMADCCRSGLLLLHGFLHESHEISQSIKSPTGSYWHGLMHRAEGDFWNSKYWYAQAGRNHPVIDKMHEHDSSWNGETFVDECERAAQSTIHSHDTINQLAHYEWFYLFQHCWTAATGA